MQFRGKNLKLVSVRPAGADAKNRPGQLSVVGESLYVSCSGGSMLELLQIQLEGKKAMSAREFINGYHPEPAEQLG